MIDLAAIRALPVVAPSADSSTRWVPFVEVPVDVVAALTDAVETASTYVAAFEDSRVAASVGSVTDSDIRRVDEARDGLAAALAKFGSAQ